MVGALVSWSIEGRREYADTRADRCTLGLQGLNQPVDLRQLVFEPGKTGLARADPVILETGGHRADLAGREARGDHVADASGALEIGRTVPAIAICIAIWLKQALRLIMTQVAFADPEPFRCFLDSHSTSLSTRGLSDLH
jgi:hypothetical protein